MKIQLQTPICQLLQIRYPIFQAGMAGGITTPEMVASVSEAGGLGSLGAAYLSPEEIRQAVRTIRQYTQKPFSVNLFALEMKDDFSRLEEVEQVLQPFYEELNIQPPSPPLQIPNRFTKQIDVLLDEKVPILSSALGIFPDEVIKEAHKQGQFVSTMVTTVEEAILAEEKGSDFIVAQGSDAGGHRGTFTLKHHPMGANIGTFSLIPQIVDHVHIPVVAAGGIMDGRGLVAALALGAQGIQLGTRFLTTIESGANATYQEALLTSTEESTVLTTAFTGRPARGLRNTLIDQFEATGVPPLPFPSQHALTSPIRQAASQQKKAQFLSLWAGQATHLLKQGQHAHEVVQEIIREAQEIIE
ncbi:NAD(P)H-dependent flavin oxidoreductase [Thermoflavimicrobium daqui]|uniref:Probable nitronate monooxygenase n=1 Tax=Thermoflavimicrobium daqui TaxID=2137476 RepID=A0A364K7P2_9BACL|nr:nitronate monooxygenase [Thermoflavimicrobium daqui]RAL26307.1 nitronate monooxygenase [Thermoflavimicrobium daqui]